MSREEYTKLMNQSVELARCHVIIEKLQNRVKQKSNDVNNLKKKIKYDENKKKAGKTKSEREDDLSQKEQISSYDTTEINVN